MLLQDGRYIYLSLSGLEVHGTTTATSGWNYSDFFQIARAGVTCLGELRGHHLGSGQVQGSTKQACKGSWLLLLD